MKKKWFYILSIILASTLIALGVVLLFVINFNDNTPEAVSFFYSDNKTYIKAEVNDNTYGYIFKFKTEENEFEIEMPGNMICVDSLLENGKMTLGIEYKISVRYKNEYENGYSNFSEEKSYLASKFLQSTTIEIDEDNLTWERVDGADFYEIVYSTPNGSLSVQTVNNFLKLETLVGGEHNFNVIAKSQKDYLLDSNMSNTIVATTYHKVLPFTDAYFDPETKMLTIVASEDNNKIEVEMGTSPLDLVHYDFVYGNKKFFTKTVRGTRYTFNIDLSLIFQEEMTIILVKPAISGYDFFEDDFMIVDFN